MKWPPIGSPRAIGSSRSFSSSVTNIPSAQVREAELMHGRQAMLAAVGMIFPKVFGKLPAPWTEAVSTNPLEAQYQVRSEVVCETCIVWWMPSRLFSCWVHVWSALRLRAHHRLDRAI